MLDKKTITAAIIITAIIGGVVMQGTTATITYECYFDKMGKIPGIKDSGKDLIICNYPSINDTYQGMYHSYFHEKDMIQQIVIDQGASYTYSGKSK